VASFGALSDGQKISRRHLLLAVATLPAGVDAASKASIANANVEAVFPGFQQALDLYRELEGTPGHQPAWRKRLTIAAQASLTGDEAKSIQARLQLLRDMPAEADSPGALAAGLASFQERHGLKKTGAADTATIRELEVSPFDRSQQLSANLAKAQKLLRTLGEKLVLVNIPEFKLYAYRKFRAMYQPSLEMRVVVGKRDRQTPPIVSRIEEVELNPYWNVPRKIAVQELADRLKDPTYFAERGFQYVATSSDGRISVSKRQSEDAWGRYLARETKLRQGPGKWNALGRFKFSFNNDDDIFLHDTLQTSGFSATNRSLSHGCVRLQNPGELASFVLPNTSLAEVNDRVERGDYLAYRLDKQDWPTLIITSLTAFPRAGQVHFRRDPYL